MRKQNRLQVAIEKLQQLYIERCTYIRASCMHLERTALLLLLIFAGALSCEKRVAQRRRCCHSICGLEHQHLRQHIP